MSKLNKNDVSRTFGKMLWYVGNIIYNVRNTNYCFINVYLLKVAVYYGMQIIKQRSINNIIFVQFGFLLFVT